MKHSSQLLIWIYSITTLALLAFSQAKELPNADPTVWQKYDAELMLNLSFIGVDRSNIRYYLAKHRSHTPAGKFGAAWVHADKGENQKAVAGYTKVIEDPNTPARMKAVAAGNRSAHASQCEHPDEVLYQNEAIELAFALGQLDLLSTKAYGDETRPTWLKMYKKYAHLLDDQRAHYLLSEARHFYYKDDYQKTKKFVDELWAMDLDEWSGDFNFSTLLSYRQDSDVYPGTSKVDALTEGEFYNKLLKYQYKTMVEVSDPCRRAVVAGWCKTYAAKIKDLDTRHGAHNLDAFHFLSGPNNSGALNLYPTGSALESAATLWNGSRDGSQLASGKPRQPEYSWKEFIHLTSTEPAIPNSLWYLERATFLAHNNQWDEARALLNKAAKSAFHPDQRAAILRSGASLILSARQLDATAGVRDLEMLFDQLSDQHKAQTASSISQIYFAAGDVPKAREWADKYSQQKNASSGYARIRQENVALLEELVKARNRYQTTNPLETKWQKQHGRQGVAVQLNFEVGSDRLPANSNQKLNPILNILNDSTYDNLVFRVEGHSDSTGSDATNDPLSIRRAQSLASHLKNQHQVQSSRIEVAGFGSRRPIASNLSKNGRALNRRVELNLMGDSSSPQLVATGNLDNYISIVSPDGKLLLSNNDEVWDTSNWVRLYSAPIPRTSGSSVFSPDGRYLFIAFENKGANVGVLLDARTGILVDFIPNLHPQYPMASPVWSPDSSRLAYSTGSYVCVYDLLNKRFDGIAALPRNNHAMMIGWIKGGKAIAANYQASNNNLYVIDSSTFQVERLSVPALSYTHGLSSSHDARYLYISNDSGYIVNWDTLNDDAPSVADFWSTALKKGYRFAAKQISVHPTQGHIIALDCMHNKVWGIIDFEKDQYVGDRADRHTRAYWGENGQELLLSGGWSANETSDTQGAEHKSGIYKLDLTKRPRVENAQLEFITGESPRLWSVMIFEEEQLIVAFSNTDISVWDINTGRQIHRWKDALSRNCSAHQSEAGAFYAIAEDQNDKETTVYRYDINQFKREEIIGFSDFEVSSMAVGEKLMILGGSPFSERNSGESTITLKAISLKSKRLFNEIDVPVTTERLQYDKIGYSGFKSIVLSPDGKQVSFLTKWADGYIAHGTRTSMQVRLWSLLDNELLEPIETSKRLDTLHYQDNNTLRVSYSSMQNDWSYNLQDRSWNDNLTRKSRPSFSADTPSSDAFKDLNLLIEYSPRGEINFIRRDLEEVVLSVLKKGEEWIAYNKAGYFAASPNGTDKVFWRVGTRMLPLSALRSKFEKPALLVHSLKSIFDKQVVRDADVVKPSIDPNLFSIPYKIKVLSPNAMETKADSYKMLVEVTVDQTNVDEPNFTWTHNGRKGRGFTVVPAKVEPTVYRAEHEFQLTEGTNVLSVALKYRGATIMPQTVTVTRKSKQISPSKVSSNSHLWFFGVGVKDYEITSQNLDYPDRDANELAKMFKSQEGKLFKEVHTKTLTNADATVRNIKIQLNRFLKQASSEDLIVIFLAGHGVISSDQELYFVAHDSDMNEAYTGLELLDFAKFLENRPPSQKALFMMDICHAGAYGTTSKRRGNALTSEEAISMIEQGTGSVVLASSTGRESSYENANFRGGHGAFTAALLEGMEGRADTEAGNGDGYVFINELTSYVSRRVPKLTDGAQHPTTPKMENLRDFPVGKKQ